MRLRITPTVLAIVTMLVLGMISLIASIGYDLSILAFIGLGLVFWGAILLYIKPEEYTRKTLLDAALSPSLITLNQMIQELGYKGDATYLPPKYFSDPETTKIYVSKQKSAILPTPEQIRNYENQPIAKTAKGLLLTPPGIQLSKLLEKSLGTSFIKTDLESLQQDLPKNLIEDLEIVENLEITQNRMAEKKGDNTASVTQVKNTTIHAKMVKPFYVDTVKQAEDPSSLATSIGGPILSAIAIAITKATGKPVRITDTKSSEDGKTVEASYEVVEE